MAMKAVEPPSLLWRRGRGIKAAGQGGDVDGAGGGR